MGKKSKRNRPSKASADAETSAESKRPAPANRTKEDFVETPDNLQFEDPYIEEYEEEEDDEWEDVDDDDDDDEKMMESEDVVQSWNPLTGEQLEPGQELEMDPTAYKMYHALSAEWPSLSFDFVRDELGQSRTRFPHTLLAAVGTQADRPEMNQLTVLKISDLAKMPAENEDDILGDEIDKDDKSSKDEDDDDESEDEIDLEPIMEHYSIKHYGGVNRVRVMPQRPEIVATWSDAGKVNLFNIESILQRFSASVGKGSITKDIPAKPFFSYSKHKEEGYAIDWSSVQQGHLVTGACNGSIHVWKPRPEGGYEVSAFYDGNTSDRSVDASPSVEDLQWSPSEATVFASAECGGFVRIFDTRASNRAMLSHKIHPSNSADVNVLSWNKLVNNLLATGGDDGTLSVWDLRHFSGEEPKPLARFTPHKTPITSVEWHPTDESMLAASDDVGSYIYDLSVEEDDTQAAGGQPDVPPQLLFVHSGSEQFKEIHWHPQITSCLMTTALSGFSIFIPSNL